MSIRNYKLSKVVLELINAKYIDRYSKNNEDEAEENQANICEENTDSDEEKIELRIGYCKLPSKDRTILKLPLAVELKSESGLTLKLIIAGYFTFKEKLTEETLKIIHEKELVENIWPYVRENISSISTKMEIEPPIILPPLDEIKNGTSM